MNLPQLTNLQAPMVQVVGPEGPIVVFRPWTDQDLKASSSHLPPITAGGEKYVIDLLSFCQQFSPTISELRRVLAHTMSASDYAKISDKLTSDRRQVNPDWDHVHNAAYRDDINTLCAAIKEKFPLKVDMTKITGCRQQDGEDPDVYLHRLTTVFNLHGGIKPPDQVGNTADTWETHLAGHFLRGLQPHISSAVQHTCIMPGQARLEDLRKHAMHAYLQHQQSARIKKEKQDQQIRQATLTLFQRDAGRGGPDHHRGRGRGRARGRGRGRGHGLCFICRSPDHWAEDCPHNNSRRCQQQQQNQPRSSSD